MITPAPARVLPSRRRRRLLGAGAALAGAGVLGGIGGCDIGLRLEEGLWNPCLPGPLPQRLAQHETVRAAWAGLDPAQVVDMHVHLAGNGAAGSGITLHPELTRPWRAFGYAHGLLFANGACIDHGRADADTAYVARLAALLDNLPHGVRALVVALDACHDAAGRPQPQRTLLGVPNAWAQRVAAAHPGRLGWIASVHPYRPDALAALDEAVRNGARAVKWIPSLMAIDPASPRCAAFYRALARLGLPLLCHGGAEHPLLGQDDELNNPLRLRAALEAGVRVVVAHCASQGEARDLDAGAGGRLLPCFELFARLMDEPRYQGLLWGDLSAALQNGRDPGIVRTLLLRSDWHGRLLNGSDYPAPGILPLTSLRRLVAAGLLAAGDVPVLDELRRFNPLLFDMVLKRRVGVAGRGWPAAVFQSAGFFGLGNAPAATPPFLPR